MAVKLTAQEQAIHDSIVDLAAALGHVPTEATPEDERRLSVTRRLLQAAAWRLTYNGGSDA